MRSRFLLIVLAGAILPLAGTGYWLTRSAVRSAEQLLHTQLDTSLATTVALVGRRWEERGADLAYLADNDVSIRALANPRASPSGDDSAFMTKAYRSFARDVPLVVLRDSKNTVRWRLEEKEIPDSGRGLPRAISPYEAGTRLTLSVPAQDPAGRMVGQLEAAILVDALFPRDSLPPLVNGTQLSVRDTRTATLFRGAGLGETAIAGRFDVDGAPWLAVQRTIPGLPLVFTLSGPAGPFLESFDRGAHIGLVLLLVIAVVAVVLTAFFTARLTRSLESLADGADAIAGGDLSLEATLVRAPTEEVRRLAGSFQTMVVSLRKTLHDLARREALAAVGEFAATMAHEVRNGLSSVRVDLQQVEETMAPDDRIGALLSRALRNVDRLNRTVTGSLGVARGDVDTWRVFDLVPVLEAAADAAEETFTKSGGVLRRNMATGCRMRGDASALEQLFVNVLINAGQSLAPGAEATLDVNVSDPKAVEVTIRDSGAGMATAQLARAGEPFYSSKPGGTGLGLSIAKKIAGAHGGELRVDSVPGEGTVVTVTLQTIADR